MTETTYSHKSYFELSKHNFAQIFTFILLLAAGISLVFVILFPVLEQFFVKFLSGAVYNHGEKVSYMIDSKANPQTTDYFFSWAVDVYKGTSQESRYWFNPVLSFISFVIIIGSVFAITISSLLPISIGFMRQKIEREIANLLNTIVVNSYGDNSDAELEEIIIQIRNADLKQMYEYSDDWGISIEDLKILQRAIIWRDASFIYQLIHLNDGLAMYMRFYFTVKYGNAVLGFVYIGAAVLIIIVGLRGLKFIPPTQPSVVLFALGLEFSLLVTYAFSLIYTKQDEENEIVRQNEFFNENAFLGSDFGSSREIEKLLRVFIKSNPKKPAAKQ
jgi:hypothetical protein